MAEPRQVRNRLRQAWIGLIALTASLVTPCRVLAEPSDRLVSISAGETKGVYLHLGVDNRPDLVFRVQLEKDGPWPEDEGLRVGIVEPSEERPRARGELRYTPAGRTLRLVAVSPRGAEPGRYPVAVLLSTREEPVDGGTVRRERIPITFVVTPGRSWAALGTRWLAAAALTVLLFFVWNMLSQRRLLSAERLADCFQPLRRDRDGLTEPIPTTDPRDNELLKAHFASRLTWSGRIRAWLKANPLAFALPGRFYEETVRLILGNRMEEISLEVVEPRRVSQQGLDPTDLEPGALYVRARTGQRLELLGRPDAQGRLGGLVLKGTPPKTHVWREMTLLTNKDSEDKFAGWKIRTVRLSSSGLLSLRRRLELS